MTQESVSKPNKPKLAMIDADVLRYEMGSLTQEHPFLPSERTPVQTEFLEQRLKDKINVIVTGSGCTDFVFYFSEGGNFRNDVARQQPYKGNRVGFERPFHWSTVNDYIKRNYKYIEVFGREADDALAERQRENGTDTIICTRDKDLLVTPGWHYRWSCGEKQKEVPPHYVDEMTAWRNFFFQMLIGDSTDNIPGCGEKLEVMWGGKLMMRRQGIGKKAAIKLLDGVTDKYTLYEVVRMEYVKRFDEAWEEKMLENARLLFVGHSESDMFNFSWMDKEW